MSPQYIMQRTVLRICSAVPKVVEYAARKTTKSTIIPILLFLFHLPYIQYRQKRSISAFIKDTYLVLVTVPLIIVLIDTLFLQGIIQPVALYGLGFGEFLCFLLDEFMLLTYHCLPDTAMIAVISDTNNDETFSFLHDTFINRISRTRLIIDSIQFLILFYILKKSIQSEKVLRILMIVSLCSFGYIWFDNRNAFFLVRYGKLLLEEKREVSGYDTIHSILQQDTTQITQNPKALPYFCLILGEAISCNHMSLKVTI